MGKIEMDLSEYHSLQEKERLLNEAVKDKEKLNEVILKKNEELKKAESLATKRVLVKHVRTTHQMIKSRLPMDVLRRRLKDKVNLIKQVSEGDTRRIPIDSFEYHLWSGLGRSAQSIQGDMAFDSAVTSLGDILEELYTETVDVNEEDMHSEWVNMEDAVKLIKEEVASEFSKNTKTILDQYPKVRKELKEVKSSVSHYKVESEDLREVVRRKKEEIDELTEVNKDLWEKLESKENLTNKESIEYLIENTEESLRLIEPPMFGSKKFNEMSKLTRNLLSVIKELNKQ